MPVFLEDNFLILEHKVSFGFVPYPSSVLIYKNRPRGNLHKSPRLSCQWSVAQQKDSRPGYHKLYNATNNGQEPILPKLINSNPGMDK